MANPDAPGERYKVYRGNRVYGATKEQK